MLSSSSLRSALAVAVFAAVATSAAPGLTLKVSGPKAVVGVDNLKIVTTLINVGDETLKLLNDPLSPLSKLPAEAFTITDTSGRHASFTGIKVKYVPAQAAKLEDDSVFTVLRPGQTVETIHDLSTTYNFTTAGEGFYRFEARKLFHLVDADKNVVPIYAAVEGHTAKISGKLAVPSPLVPRIERRASYIGCSDSQQTQLGLAASAAQSYATSALSYLRSHMHTATTRYTTWFGLFASSRVNNVGAHFTKINNNTFALYTYDCTCNRSDIYAFVNPYRTGIVTLCGAFWRAPLTGTDSQGGTIIHESSHYIVNGATHDHVYGQANAKLLAHINPSRAVDNADSHEYFAENNPALS